MTAEEKLAEFKLACRDRSTHPEAAQRLWEEFIELVEKEKENKEHEKSVHLPR